MKIRQFFIIFTTTVFFILSLNAMDSSVNIKESNDELLNISVNNSINSKDFNVFANFIFWTAKEASADCWAEVITSDSSTSSNDIQQVHFGWDPGFKVGVGYKMNQDQWDTQLYYTWFHTRGNDYISSNPGTIHSTFLGNFYINNADGSGLSGPAYQKASIDWTIKLNMIDWELGRKFWFTKSLALHTFLGLKGAWIDQSIHSKWQNPDLPINDFFYVGIENLKNNYRGIGPKVGINTKWNLFSNQSQFYFLGDFSGSIMWGHWSFFDVFQNDLPQQVSVDLQNINGGSSMLQMFMGFEWDSNFSQKQHRFSTKLGYEMQFWLDQLQFYSFTGGRLVNELTLQGGTLEFYFNF
ncbi:MAG: hypothetical protein K1060chlam5_01178 [Candidatus Anoxychlamydiales bacterium]|nr:hypothetical protein [Candidatus Anoxychlamydiales bacterium]